MAATPTVALRGSGSTGASAAADGARLRCTWSASVRRPQFCRSARGFRRQSAVHQSVANYSGYYNSNATLLRLRTAHAGLQWQHTEAYFSLDRPIFSPDVPTSLTAVAVPALAWSGNLWTWNPQVGVTQDLGFAGSRDVRLQAALIDVGDTPLSPSISPSGSATGTTANTAEQSRWPGVEARVALLGSKLNDDRNHIGIGGYFAPHTSLGYDFDSWAATLDGRLLFRPICN